MATTTSEVTTVPPRLLDLDGACEFLGGISRRSLERLIEQRRLRPVKLGLRRVLLRVEDLEKLARAR